VEGKAEEDKTLRFLINSEECYEKMSEICRIREEKRSQKNQLDSKMGKIKRII
jgi:hypothetical protein